MLVLRFFALLGLAFTLELTAWGADWRDDFTRQLKNGSALVERSDGTTLFSYRPKDSMVPASTLKVATSYCVLEELGPDFRIATEFLTDDTGTLFIRGGGDPSLVSEKFKNIALRIRTLLPNFSRIVVDDTRFDSGLTISGASKTTNPYDAPPGAFLVNFNTVAVNKRSNSKIEQGEEQTPLTPIARDLAKPLAVGNHRINIGSDVRLGTRYAAELLATMVFEGTKIRLPQIDFGVVPKSAKLLFRYESPDPLSEMVRGLLKFSTNFTANQLFLIMGAEKLGYPATIAKGKQVLSKCLQERVRWNAFNVEEGAGLSRRNQVTAEQMLRLLRAFEPYKDLLPTDKGFRAKTGTLTGVNTLVGYFDLPDGQTARFAILVNSEVAADYKFQLAHTLYRGITGPGRAGR